MIPLSARDIAGAIGGELVGGAADAEAVAVAIDSRAVTSGACFVAIEGPRDDGHRYLGDAVAAGATVLVVRRPEAVRDQGIATIRADDTTVALQRLSRHVRQRLDPTVVAITGSIGKTTTKALVRDVLAARQRVHASPGNLNNQWGLPLSLLGLTPEHEVMIAELGMSGPGEIRDLTRLAIPDIGVITNVAPVHMEFFDDLEGIAAAKEELAEELPPGSTLIVNADDPRTVAMAERHRGRLRRVLTFGVGEDADVRAVDARPSPCGWQLRLLTPDDDPVDVDLPLPGDHSLTNFLAAAGVAYAMGLPARRVAAAAAGLGLPPRRGQIVRLPGGPTVIDDSYNASPRAMMSALDSLARFPTDGRRVLAAGDMLELGSWAEEAHREVGLHAGQLRIDLLVTAGRLARDIAVGARAAGLPADAVWEFDDAEEAATALVEELRSGDVVLVKGSRALRMERVAEAIEAAWRDRRPGGGEAAADAELAAGAGSAAGADTAAGADRGADAEPAATEGV